MIPKPFRAAFAALATLLSAQAPDPDLMGADVSTLASPGFEGRLTGTPGQMKAARLVADRFEHLGLQPLGAGPEPFFLSYRMELRSVETEHSFLTLNHHRVPFGPGAATFWLTPRETDLRFIPEGMDPGPSARGQWIARFAPLGFQPRDADDLLAQALESGAGGLVLLPRPGKDELDGLRKQILRLLGRSRYALPADGPPPAAHPLAVIDATVAAELGLDLPALWQTRAVKDLGEFQIRPTVAIRELRPVNVAGLLKGSDPNLKDEILVLSAHEDHLGTVGGHLYPGADDNASGTAVLMEVARLLEDAKPRRSILFLSLSGEEEGLFGSRAFVAHPPVPLESIVADLNADMVGRNRTDTLSVTPACIPGATGTLTRDARELARGLNLTLTDEADAYWKRSDHYTFAEAGIPAIFFFGGMEPDYHQTTDTADKVEPAKLVNVAELLRRLALRIANADSRPESLPDSAWKPWIWPSR